MIQQEPKYKLFLVEDDPGITAGIRGLSESWGFDFRACGNFRSVTEEFQAFAPHIVLLDVMLPFANGYHWCGEIRRLSQVPILFISSAGDSMNIVMAMNMGADDFIVKPFDGNVLIAKVQALLRRSYDYAGQRHVLTHRGAFLDTDNNTLTVNDDRVELSRNEYRILLCLMENKGRVVSRETLMERLWETDAFVDENTLTVNVNRLRKKLDATGLTGFITTRFGVGYLVE